MRFKSSFLYAVSSVAVLISFSGASGAQAAPSAQGCSGLVALSMSLPQVTITSAQSVPAGAFTAPDGTVFNNLPAFCRVVAVATPTSQSNINFEVWMPSDGSWNGKFQGEGSGGSAGAISFSAMGPALVRGYASMSNDNGHTGSVWTFAQFPEKVVDFGHRAQHVTTVAGKAIIKAFYGDAAKHSYFYACSQGGHHALMEAQRYPEDYDGIIAGDPANDWTHLMFGELWAGLNTSVKGPSFDLPQAKLDLVTSAAIAQCKGQDGSPRSDAFLTDPLDCKFDPKVLLCKAGDAPTCLTQDQLTAVNALYQGPVNPVTHKQIFPGFARGSETFWRQVLVGLSIPGGSSASFFRDGVFPGLANFNDINFSTDVKLTDNKAAGSGETWAQALDANNADLREFRERGGKLIMYHGFADPFITPLISLDYYTAVIDQMRSDHDGQQDDDGLGAVAATQKFARLFMVPGMNHCAGGPGPNNFGGYGQAPGAPQDPQHDVLSALERWVEKGIAPDNIIGTKFVNDKPANGVAFTRPLCPYPLGARFLGGNVNDAASFACVKDEHDRIGPVFTDFEADQDRN
jgi:feruloyl esterase